MSDSSAFRKWLVRLGIPLGILIAVWVARVTVLAEPPLAVETAEVATGRVEQTVTNSRAGTLRARVRTRLSPEVGGRVVALPFREGDRVRAGQVVLQLDDRLQRAQATLAERQLDAAGAERDRACLVAQRAEREHLRISRLASDRIVSEDVLDQAASSRDTAEATCSAGGSRVEQARAALALARVELDKMTLRAPFDGLVAEVSIEIGEWTSPSPPALPIPPVIDVLDPDSIYVSAPMDEVDAASLVAGQSARVTVDSHRGQSFSGRLVRVADYVLDVEQQNRTLEVEVELEDRELAATLRPGTSADVEVILAVCDDVLRAPAAAVFEGTHVLIVEGDRLVERELAVGLRNWDWVEVRGGIHLGEQVVTSLDRAGVRAGAKVALRTSP